METRANYVMVGSFVLFVLTGIFVAILWLGNAQFNRQYDYYDVYFSGSVTGLGVGAAVNYNGVAIGRVADIELDPQNPEQVLVTLEVNAKVPIKSDAVASLEIPGITGVAYVEISGGSREAPPLQTLDGQRYPVIASRPSQLQSVVESAPEVMNRLIIVADRLADLLDERNRAAIADSLQNIRQITAAGAHDMAKLDTLLDDSDATMKELKKTATAADAVIGDATTTVRQIGTTGKDADSLIQDMRPGLRDFSQSGLNQTQQLITDLRVLVANLTRVVTELERDPPRFLFGEHSEGYKPK